VKELDTDCKSNAWPYRLHIALLPEKTARALFLYDPAKLQTESLVSSGCIYRNTCVCVCYHFGYESAESFNPQRCRRSEAVNTFCVGMNVAVSVKRVWVWVVFSGCCPLLPPEQDAGYSVSVQGRRGGWGMRAGKSTAINTLSGSSN
jgi:hypothetical protein